MNEKFESIWDAIEDDPAEAQNMKLRSAMMTALCGYIKSEGLTQKQAAKKLGVTQPRISDLMRGHIDLFAIDSLGQYAGHGRTANRDAYWEGSLR
jgi:predicted XRE-type DNA-binding protein